MVVSRRLLVRLGLLVLSAAGCSDAPADRRYQRFMPAPEPGCVDLDGDGRGEGCRAGADCSEADPTLWQGCGRCEGPEPALGCDCEPGTAPVSCYLEPSADSDGRIMCHEGTRFCRQGQWSTCEGIQSYDAPPGPATAIIDPDAGPVQCNICNPICYRITDRLEPAAGTLVDGGVGSQVAWADGGGLTLALDPDTAEPDGGVVAVPDCMLGTAPDRDCDGIDDIFDPYPDEKPFATANPAIFLDIPPGDVGTGQIDLTFFLNSADIYFLVDQSGSMGGERDQLVADLTSGDFIQDPAYNCADYDFDGAPNNELKAGGIIGAARCFIRDSQFGVGLFREIPFSSGWGGYADSDQIVFDHGHDITDSVDDVQTAVEALQVIGNKDWPEASALALHNVVTGNGMYFGIDKPGIPPRTDCGPNRWGYPCFRAGAIPIIILFTDAQMHNGPPSNNHAYNASYLDMDVGTDAAYVPVTTAIEDFATAQPAGDVTNALLTFTGDSSQMVEDVGADLMSCLGTGGGSDAVFEFTLSQARDVLISTEGSRYDTVLSLFDGIPVTQTPLPDSGNTNETTGSATSFGAIDGLSLTVAGNTGGMFAEYDSSTAGCDAGWGAPDAFYSFSLAADATVRLDTVGSGFDTVLTLYDSPPSQKPSYTQLPDTNDDLPAAHDLLDVLGTSVAVRGDTSAAGIGPDFTGGDIGCGASDAAADATHSFALSGNTRVRISTEGSGFDTVLALVDDACVGDPSGCAYASTADVSVPGSAEDVATAHALGALDNRILQLSGSTWSMDADFNGSDIGCSANDSARDAVFAFSLAAMTDVEIDTTGSSFDTVVGLMGAPALASESHASDGTNEDTDTAQDLGTLDGKQLVVTGSTTGHTADHTSAEIGCAPNSDGAADLAFSFHLDAPTRVRLDTLGSSYDTVLSLHDGAIQEPGSDIHLALDQSSEHPGNAYTVAASLDGNRHVITGNTTGMDPNFDFPTWSDDSPDTLVRFTVGTAGSYQIDTEGSDFDTYLCLYPVPAGTDAVPQIDVGNNHGSLASARQLGDMNLWMHDFTGTTTSNTFDASDCPGVSGSADDAIYEFTVSADGDFEFTTLNSSFDTALVLYKWDDAGHSSYSYVDCNIDRGGSWRVRNTSRLRPSLAPGDYFLVVTGDDWNDDGDYDLALIPDSLGGDNAIECDDDGGAGLTSRISRFFSAGDYYAVVKGYNAWAHGDYVLNLTDPAVAGGAGDPHQVDCNDDAVGATSEIDSVTDLPAGDYYVVVKGSTALDDGAFQLTITDEGYVPTPGLLACDHSSGGGDVSLLTYPNLPAGDYYVVLKGDRNSDRGNYEVRIRDLLAETMPVLQCDDNGGYDGSSVIERDLVAGNYSVIVKGAGAADDGDYRLLVRDVGNLPYGRLACDDDGAGGGSSAITQSLTAGTYYVGIKGDGATEGGAYQLNLRDGAVGGGDIACNDDGGSYRTSVIQKTLAPGTYYAVVKGYDAADDGDFQLTVGGGSASSTKYVPPTWTETLTALQATETRVMTVLSCHDDPFNGDASGDCVETRDQATDLANGTGALGASLQPLVFDIDSDGSGLSKTVVDGIASLTEYLEMDIEVQILFYPDENPTATPFLVTIEAVSQPGDDCDGVIGNTFQNCKPGATPRFLIKFENPIDNPVPLNPDDPLGGYNFRAQLIGDGQFLVDEVPIYIIPEDVVPDDEELGTYADGAYWQDIHAAGCDVNLNERPDWDELTWVGSAPEGATIRFKACGGDTAGSLETCSNYTIAEINGVGSCAVDADCVEGYCDTDVGACQIATAGACTMDAQCPANATCLAGLCNFDNQPVDIGYALAGMDGAGNGNLKPYLRLTIELSVQDIYAEPPILYEWGLTYLCTTTE